jgi:hypothetical protein
MTLIFNPNFIINILIKNKKELDFQEHITFFPFLELLTFRYQSKKFGSVNLLASNILCNDIFIFIHGNLLTYLCKDNEY